MPRQQLSITSVDPEVVMGLCRTRASASRRSGGRTQARCSLAQMSRPWTSPAPGPNPVHETGESVASWLQRRRVERLFDRSGSAPEQRRRDLLATAELARQLACELNFHHSRGVIHGSLAKQNIWLRPADPAKGYNQIVFLEFGFAVRIADWLGAEPDSESKGAPTSGMPPEPAQEIHQRLLYLAPEQWRAEGKIDGSADVYALGALLYELLLGEPPFTASTLVSLSSQHRFRQPVPLRRLVPAIPPALADLVQRMLAKSSALRPRPSEVADSLSRVATTLRNELHEETIEHLWLGEVMRSERAPEQPRKEAPPLPFAVSVQTLLAAAFLMAVTAVILR